jgi:hypothetical protein
VLSQQHAVPQPYAEPVAILFNKSDPNDDAHCVADREPVAVSERVWDAVADSDAVRDADADLDALPKPVWFA